jgi:hypothetical protein
MELAGNRARERERDSDENFDPYGKDDPTSKKWGEAAGLGNRYGGMRTGAEAKGTGGSGERNADRDDRESRRSRGEEGGRR